MASTSTTTTTANLPPTAANRGQFVELVDIGWAQYVVISESIDRSLGLPGLTPADVLERLRLANSIGTGEGFSRLNN